METATTNDAGNGTRALILSLIALDYRQMLSTLPPTIPAVPPQLEQQIIINSPKPPSIAGRPPGLARHS